MRRAMTQRAIRPVTLATLTRDPLSRVKVARLCRRCDIGLRVRDSQMAILTAAVVAVAIATLRYSSHKSTTSSVKR